MHIKNQKINKQFKFLANVFKLHNYKFFKINKIILKDFEETYNFNVFIFDRFHILNYFRKKYLSHQKQYKFV